MRSETMARQRELPLTQVHLAAAPGARPSGRFSGRAALTPSWRPGSLPERHGDRLLELPAPNPAYSSLSLREKGLGGETR